MIEFKLRRSKIRYISKQPSIINFMALVDASKTILAQLKSLIAQLSDDEYTRGLDVFSGASVGQHTRHILEFYQCILQCGDHTTLNYDERCRDPHIETSTSFSLSVIDHLFAELNTGVADKEIMVCGELGGSFNKVGSTIFRELLYAIEHAVHHMAILKIGVITNFTHLTIAPNFGVAESTIKYKTEQLIKS